MSYTIETGKKVLSLRTDDKRIADYPGMELLIFCQAAACNNLHPRTYDWNVIATDTCREWSGEIMLPAALWQMGYAADGGSIKPDNRNVSGTAYIRQWKRAVKDSTPLLDQDGTSRWSPRLTFWLRDERDGDPHTADEINRQGAELFGRYQHLRQPLHDAFRRLFPEPISGLHDSVTCHGTDQLFDALYLYRHRAHLPFQFFITDSERSAFLGAQDGPQQRGAA